MDHLYTDSLDVDPASLDAKKAVYEVLSGSAGPFPIEIDEVLVTNAWRPNICMPDRHISPARRVFLRGDAARENIPFCGWGMYTTLGDSFEVGRNVAAVLDRYGSQHLLRPYEIECRPVVVRNIDYSGVHAAVHFEQREWCQDPGSKIVTSKTEEQQKVQTKIADHLHGHNDENKPDYRRNKSPVINPDKGVDTACLEQSTIYSPRIGQAPEHHAFSRWMIRPLSPTFPVPSILLSILQKIENGPHISSLWPEVMQFL